MAACLRSIRRRPEFLVAFDPMSQRRRFLPSPRAFEGESRHSRMTGRKEPFGGKGDESSRGAAGR